MMVSISNLLQKIAIPKLPKRQAGPVSINPLMIIAVIFAASFAGRAVGIANATLNRPDAEEAKTETPASDLTPPTQLLPQTADASAHDDTDTSEQEATLDKPAAPVSAAHRAAQYTDLMAAIRERSAMLDDKSTQIEDRIRTLEILEERIEEKLAALKESNEELTKLVSYASEASQEDISTLASMYEQMKPQRAAEIFDKMNATFAAGFLTEMSTENAALILTNMTTEKAYEASMIIASRNAAVHQ